MVKLTAVVDGAKGYEKETHSTVDPPLAQTALGEAGPTAGANRTHPETEYLV